MCWPGKRSVACHCTDTAHGMFLPDEARACARACDCAHAGGSRKRFADRG